VAARTGRSQSFVGVHHSNIIHFVVLGVEEISVLGDTIQIIYPEVTFFVSWVRTETSDLADEGEE
jgi:hypothetical protein